MFAARFPAEGPLAQVQLSLGRTAPQLTAIAPIENLLSRFLDGSWHVSPQRAAASGSVRLFQRVISRLKDGATDPMKLSYTLSSCLEEAIKADDLAMVYAVHDLRAEPLDLKWLKCAMAHASLEVVQWVYEHRPDPLDSGKDVVMQAARAIGRKDTFRIGKWMIDADLLDVQDRSEADAQGSRALTLPALFALLQSAELVRWVDASGLLPDPNASDLLGVSLNELNEASTEIVKYLLERGYTPRQPFDWVSCLVKASCVPDREALVERVINSPIVEAFRNDIVYAATRPGGAKVLQLPPQYDQTTSMTGASTTMSYAISFGHLDTIKWLVETRGETVVYPPIDGVSEECTMAIITWLHSSGRGQWTPEIMDYAASNGHLKILKWLHTNRTEGCTHRAMDYAAGQNRLDAVQWLHANRSEGCSAAAMTDAASRGHLAVVQWLHGNRTEGDVSLAMAHATANGQLDVAEWCIRQNGCAFCVHANVSTRLTSFTSTSESDRTDSQALTLQWLAAHKTTKAVGCTGDCVVVANAFPWM